MAEKLPKVVNEGLNNVISIIINDTTIANADASGKVHYTQRTVNLNDSEGPVTFSLFFSDSAGNQGTNVTETSDGSTVGIDISNPSINSLMEWFDNLDPKYYNNYLEWLLGYNSFAIYGVLIFFLSDLLENIV